MKQIIEPIDRSLLREELNATRFLRSTRKGGNEIYRVNAHNAPNVLREIGRLRELTFRAAGGGTGAELDLDEHDFGPFAYEQLIVWSEEDQQIIGGYRYKVCAEARDANGNYQLSTVHYFDFSQRFKTDFLPYTIELGRSWVQPDFQPNINPKKDFSPWITSGMASVHSFDFIHKSSISSEKLPCIQTTTVKAVIFY